MKTLTLLAALLFAPVALADDATKKTDDTAKTDKAKPAKLDAKELQVLAHYHALNTMEVELGSIAEKRVTRDAVKSYAAMLVKDHGDSNKELIAFAKKRGQKIPAVKPATAAEKEERSAVKAEVAALKKLQGAAFEAEYLRMMVEGHEKELAKVDLKVAEVKDPELADMVKAKKATLQHHADMARELRVGDAQARR